MCFIFIDLINELFMLPLYQADILCYCIIKTIYGLCQLLTASRNPFRNMCDAIETAICKRLHISTTMHKSFISQKENQRPLNRLHCTPCKDLYHTPRCIITIYYLKCTEQYINSIYTNEPRHEKTNILVSDRVRHNPVCTATEDG